MKKEFWYYMEMVQDTKFTDSEVEKLMSELVSKSNLNHAVQSQMPMDELLKICKEYTAKISLYPGFRSDLITRLKKHSNANFRNFGQWLADNENKKLK